MINRFDNPRAFATFFTERITLKAERAGMKIRGTYAACVFTGTAADPLAAMTSETDVVTATVLISKAGPYGWNQPDPPRVGDKIFHNGNIYAVTKRDKFITDHHHLEARLCK